MAEDNPVRIKEEAVDIEIPHSPGGHGNIEEPEMVDASNPICVKEEPEDTSLSVLLENHGNSEEFITDDYPAMDASNSIHIKEEPQDSLFILPGDYGNGEEFVTDDCNGSRTTTGNSICMPCKTPDASSYVLPGNYEDAEELVTGHGDIVSLHPVGKYAKYTCQFKLAVVKHAEENGNRDAARHFVVNESQVRYWRKQKDSLVSTEGTRMAFRGPKAGKFSQVESALLAYVQERQQKGLVVSCEIMQTFALKTARMLGIGASDFKASNGWTVRFMRRHGLSLRKRASQC